MYKVESVLVYCRVDANSIMSDLLIFVKRLTTLEIKDNLQASSHLVRIRSYQLHQQIKHIWEQN